MSQQEVAESIRALDQEEDVLSKQLEVIYEKRARLCALCQHQTTDGCSAMEYDPALEVELCAICGMVDLSFETNDPLE